MNPRTSGAIAQEEGPFAPGLHDRPFVGLSHAAVMGRVVGAQEQGMSELVGDDANNNEYADAMREAGMEERNPPREGDVAGVLQDHGERPPGNDSLQRPAGRWSASRGVHLGGSLSEDNPPPSRAAPPRGTPSRSDGSDEARDRRGGRRRRS